MSAPWRTSTTPTGCRSCSRRVARRLGLPRCRLMSRMKTSTAASTRGPTPAKSFIAPPPPPSPYARGPYNNTGLGELMVRRGPSGAVAYIGCNTGGQPCGLTLLEGFVRSLPTCPSRHSAIAGPRHQPLLRGRAPRNDQAQPRLVSPEHLLPGHEVHGLRRPRAFAAGAALDRMVRKSGPYSTRSARAGPYNRWSATADLTAVFLPRFLADAGDCVRPPRPSGPADGLRNGPFPGVFDCGASPLRLACGLRQHPGRDAWLVPAPHHVRNAGACRIGGRRQLGHRRDAPRLHDERRPRAQQLGGQCVIRPGSAADSSGGGDCRRRLRVPGLPAVLAASAAHGTDATGRPAGGSAGARPLPP